MARTGLTIKILCVILAVITIASVTTLYSWDMYIKPLGSKKFTVSFHESAISLDTLKSAVTNHFAKRGNTIAQSAQTFLFRDKHLTALSLDQNLFEGQTLTLLIYTKNSEPKTITVQDTKRTLHTIKFANEITVAEIKEQLAALVQIPKESIMLFFANKSVSNAYTLNQSSNLAMITRTEYMLSRHINHLIASFAP